MIHTLTELVAMKRGSSQDRHSEAITLQVNKNIVMAKPTKSNASQKSESPAPVTGIDLSTLTPEQLASLQKQIKAKKKEKSSKKDERFMIIDTMLAEKEEGSDTEFRHTTRDILNTLVKNDLVDTTEPGFDTVEIKKIQARKQFLEKKTDEKGELVHAKGSFGYKASGGGFAVLTASRIATWFTVPANVAQVTPTQVTAILAVLK